MARTIMAISLSVVIVTIAIVGAGLWASGYELGLALLLGAIATATDPAATQDVIHQADAKGAVRRHADRGSSPSTTPGAFWPSAWC